MKSKILFFSLLALATALTCSAQETVISGKDIPHEITSYVATNFPNQKLIQAVKDKDDLKIEYEILLDDQTKLEFNEKKQIKEVDGKSKLPDRVIPSKILSYVKSNYPNNFITDWELEGHRKQQIELNNDISLEFNLNGDFLRIDD